MDLTRRLGGERMGVAPVLADAAPADMGGLHVAQATGQHVGRDWVPNRPCVRRPRINHHEIGEPTRRKTADAVRNTERLRRADRVQAQHLVHA